MRNVLIIIFLFVASVVAFAQINSGYSVGSNCEVLIGEPFGLSESSYITVGALQGKVELIGSGVDVVKVDEENFLIAPNPVDDALRLIVPQKYLNESCEIAIFSLDGKQMFMQKCESLAGTSFDVSALSVGVYILRITTSSNNIIFSSRLIKQ